MPTDVLILGGFVFEDFAAPDRLPFGGQQVLTVQRMPGGQRVVDAWGPDDEERSWSGTLWGDDALSDALALDAMRRAGEPVDYSNSAESRTVIIKQFSPVIRKLTCVEYRITVVPTDDDAGTGGGLGFGSIDSLVALDVAAVVGLLG